MARRVASRPQKVQDVAGLDVEVSRELLNLDSARLSGGYVRSFLCNSTGNDTVLIHYSRSKPLPIFGPQLHTECPIETAAPSRLGPAGLVSAQVGAATGPPPPGIGFNPPIDDGQADQGALGLDLPAADAGAMRLS